MNTKYIAGVDYFASNENSGILPIEQITDASASFSA